MGPPAMEDEGIHGIVDGQKDVKVRYGAQDTAKKRRLARSEFLAEAQRGNRRPEGELCQ